MLGSFCNRLRLSVPVPPVFKGWGSRMKLPEDLRFFKSILGEKVHNEFVAEEGEVFSPEEIYNDNKAIIDQAADRGAFICQSQSLNIFMEKANFGKLTSMHFYGWEKGLKTGMYYLRTKAAVDAIKFTLNNDKKAEPLEVKEPVAEQQPLQPIAALNEPVEMTKEEYRAMIELAKNAGPEDCEMCGS